MRSPHTIGLEWPRPGIGVFHNTLIDFSASQLVGRVLPSLTPDPFCPRKEGQFCECATDESPMQSTSVIKNFIKVYFFFFLSMYSLANVMRRALLFKPIRLASSNALSYSHPSRTTRRINQKAPTRTATAQR